MSPHAVIPAFAGMTGRGVCALRGCLCPPGEIARQFQAGAAVGVIAVFAAVDGVAFFPVALFEEFIVRPDFKQHGGGPRRLGDRFRGGK